MREGLIRIVKSKRKGIRETGREKGSRNVLFQGGWK